MPLHDIKTDDWKHRALRAEARIEQIAELLHEAQRETWHGLTANPEWINRKVTEALNVARGKEQQ
jgi:hypothetical protein